MAYTLCNKCAINCCNRTILVQLIVEDAVVMFFGTQCIYMYSAHFCSEAYTQGVQAWIT